MKKFSFGGMGLKVQLLRGGIAGFLVKILATAAAFLSSVLIARVLGGEEFGAYTLVISVTTLISIPVSVGLPTLVMRETARAEVERDWSLMSGIWVWSNGVIIFATGVACLLVLLIVTFLSQHITEVTANTLLVAVCLVLPIALSACISGALRGLRKVFSSQFSVEVMRPVMLMVFVGVAILIGWTPINSANVIVFFGVATIISLILSIIFLKYSLPDGFNGFSRRKYQSKKWLRSVLPLSLMSGLLVISQNTDFVMLGFFRSNLEVGLYKVAVSGATIAILGLTVIQMVCMPYVTRFYQQKDFSRLQILASLSAGLGTLFTLPVVIVFYFFSKPILSFIYGPEFIGAGNALLVLCIAQLINAYFGIVWPLLVMTGNEKLGMYGLLLSTLINVGLNAILIPPFGIEGAAIATAISIATWNILFWMLVKKKLNIDGSPIALFNCSSLRKMREGFCDFFNIT